MTESTKVIDAPHMVKLLEHIVDEYGEEHRARGVYIDPATDEKVCIAGKALSLIGVSDERLVRFGLRSLGSLWHRDLIPEIDEKAMNLLDLAQLVQDREGTWGEALAAVRTRMNSLSQ